MKTHDGVPLGAWVRRFLLEHLVVERNLSCNTQRSYRDTLRVIPRGRYRTDKQCGVWTKPLTSRVVRRPGFRLEHERAHLVQLTSTAVPASNAVKSMGPWRPPRVIPR